MSYDNLHHYGEIPDADDEIWQLIAEFPELVNDLIVTQSLSPLSPSTSTPTSVLTPASNLNQVVHPPLICQWILAQDPQHICGATLSTDPKLACIHFREAHDVRGNEKVTVSCRWHDCQVPPMQRGSLIRHVSSVHLGILKWRCELCGKVLSRRGTAHACADSQEAE